jgi:dienelactone hydrolase
MPEALQGENWPVRWLVYPNASHAFDQPGPRRTYLGHYMAYDASATADAQKQVRRFLAEFLR